jgi:hypothetical protein
MYIPAMLTICTFAPLQVVKMLRFNGTRVPQDYEVRFQLALWAFRHCRVYCPAAKVRLPAVLAGENQKASSGLWPGQQSVALQVLHYFHILQVSL